MKFNLASTPTPPVVGRILLPLRAFLGFTFSFAGLQKLANPKFFDASDPASIQSQLAGSARLSPIHALISPLTHVAVPLGVLIALGELAIGAATLLGLSARLAAIGGMALSFMLFLTVSFHASPYYTGSDIVFVFAWTPLVLGGTGSVLSLDAKIVGWAENRARTENRARAEHPTEHPHARSRFAEEEVSRREATLKATAGGAVVAVSLIVGGLAAGIGRLVGGTARGTGTRTLPTHPLTRRAGRSRTPTTTPKPGKRSAGTAIGRASQVPVGNAATFQDPKTGDPSIVVQPSAGKFLAFDAICPHAGCVVAYNTSARLFVCPCHGSEFNASTGAVERGPAATGLTKVGITESGGQLYVS